ncbi:retrovirus-related Pol polyprotein from transposon 17.6 [Trichonephila clavipes]|uniref:RNA-directed DNA polymerase n=1 Tax=Trichonephila clavipes TaxID=2585209 RepID=A0A8X6ST70_TRICX|nr:retrovirus-related Pol polyprotein from transposon 17.6 [Trichonephila clavipes]
MEDAVELIHSIGRANIITTLDLLKGYWAIPMAEDSKNLTSFKTHRQQYRFKCAFGKAQIKYLGHIIGSGKHEPDPEKTAVINNLPVPKTKKELRSVLGLCNYYREYIPKYSELVYPLTELTKKRVPDSIPWTEKHDSSFHLLKKALVEAPSLYSPVPDKPYTIHSDASQIGIAACLSQKCGDKCYPIAYASQKLSKTQQSWSTIEREAFAIVWSLKSLKYGYLGLKLNFILIITLYPT